MNAVPALVVWLCPCSFCPSFGCTAKTEARVTRMSALLHVMWRKRSRDLCRSLTSGSALPTVLCLSLFMLRFPSVLPDDFSAAELTSDSVRPPMRRAYDGCSEARVSTQTADGMEICVRSRYFHDIQVESAAGRKVTSSDFQ